LGRASNVNLPHPPKNPVFFHETLLSEFGSHPGLHFSLSCV
jgi:hypothetical protein